jgi:flavodoxin I
MNTILIVYWPLGGNAEMAAKAIASKFADKNTVLKPVSEVTINELTAADLVIAGGSTVGAGKWQDASSSNKWSQFFKDLPQGCLTGKKLALFGLGDQILYPDNFVDGLGVMHEEFAKTNAAFIGEWPVEGYRFTNSQGVVNNMFVGLALDEDRQPELTHDRIQTWAEQLKKSM